MENFLHYCEYIGIVNLRLTKLAVRPLSSSRPVRLGRGEGQGEEANAAASKSRLMESLLLLSEPIATMNRCYARGLTAVPSPLPEGEGRGEGEFCRLRPYGSSKGSPYARTRRPFVSAFTALLLVSAAPATAATNGPDLAPLGPFPVGITTALL